MAPMAYDLPQVEQGTVPLQRFEAPQPKNFAGPQLEAQGQAITKAGEAAMAIEQDFQNRVDDARVKGEDNAAASAINDLLVTGETPYFGTLGRDAVDSAKGVVDALKKIGEQAQERLENDTQRYLFNRAFEKRFNQAALQVGEHRLQQAKAYDLAETEKRADVNASAAVSQWGTWKMEDSPYQTALRVSAQSMDEALQRRGIPLDSDQAKAARLVQSTQIHMNVLGQMLTAQKPAEAKEYFDRFQSDIDPKRWDDIGRLLKTTNAEQEGIQLAMGLSAKFGTDDYTKILQEGFKSLGGDGAGFKADSYRVFSAQLASLHQDWTIQRKETREKLTSPIYESILKARASGTPMLPGDLLKDPGFNALRMSTDPDAAKEADALMDTVTREYRANRPLVVDEAMAPVYRALAEYAASHEGRVKPTDFSSWPEMQALREKAATDPELGKALFAVTEKVATDWTGYQNQLRSQRSEARQEARIGAATAKQEEKDAQAARWMDLYSDPDRVAQMTRGEMLKEATGLGHYGVDLTKLWEKTHAPDALAQVKIEAAQFKAVRAAIGMDKKSDDPKAALVQQQLQKYLAAEQQQAGRVLKPDEIRRAIGAAIQDVQVQYTGGFLGQGGTRTQKLYELENPDNMIIPKEREAEVTGALRSRGLANTPHNRATVYRALLEREDRLTRGK